MAAQRVTLTIPNACQQRWQALTVQPNGRFCENCQKTVVDFTTMTDRQVTAYFLNRSGNVCGRFSASQLNRAMVSAPAAQNQPQSARQRWLALTALGLISWSTMSAQSTGTPAERVAVSRLIRADKRLTASVPETTPALDSMVTMSGRVLDATENEWLSGVNVLIAKTNRGTTTDKEGSFTIQTPAHKLDKIILKISCIGYVTQEVEIDVAKNAPVVVRLAQDTEALNQVVFVGEVTVVRQKTKPTFLDKLQDRFQPK